MASSQSITAEQGQLLLRLARASLEHAVRTGEPLNLEKTPDEAPTGHFGAFVSLHTRDGNLRGCIGHMVSDQPLFELILELAVAAGFHDPRFGPVQKHELPNLVYEISVLSPMQPIQPKDVKPGVHGLLVKRGRRQGVLLPQVATEAGWDRETFLAHTCLKAGLPEVAWREPGTEVLAFTAQVFGEVDRHEAAAAPWSA